MSENRMSSGSAKSPKRVFVLLTLASVLLTGCGREFLVLNPAGPVAEVEKRLIVISTILVLIVIIPVIGLFAYIVNKYRDRPGNTAPYDPEWSESRSLEVIWWGIPILIIGILGTLTARDTFALTRPPAPPKGPMTVEVMSLNWKWYFQYPEQKVATVNYCVIPTNRPVQFVLTADAPMNSFWVPELGGQEYTMPGMAMRLWLQANKPGTYFGHGANFTGEGYAHMKFNVVAKPQDQFNTWVQQTRQGSPALTMAGFQNLVHPGLVQQLSFSSYPQGIFQDTVKQSGGMYMKRDLTILNQSKTAKNSP